MVFLVLEQHVEGREAAVDPRDVLLQVHLVLVGQFVLGVDLLFHDAQAVSHHDNLVEEGFHRHLFGLQSVVAGLHDERAAVPPVAKFDGGRFDVLLNAVDVLFEDLLHRRGQIAQVDRPFFHAFLHKFPAVERLVELLLAVLLEKHAPEVAVLVEDDPLAVVGVVDFCAKCCHGMQSATTAVTYACAPRRVSTLARGNLWTSCPTRFGASCEI